MLSFYNEWFSVSIFSVKRFVTFHLWDVTTNFFYSSETLRLALTVFDPSDCKCILDCLVVFLLDVCYNENQIVTLRKRGFLHFRDGNFSM